MIMLDSHRLQRSVRQGKNSVSWPLCKERMQFQAIINSSWLQHIDNRVRLGPMPLYGSSENRSLHNNIIVFHFLQGMWLWLEGLWPKELLWKVSPHATAKCKFQEWLLQWPYRISQGLWEVPVDTLLSPGSYSTPSYWGGTGNRISSARALPPKGAKAIVLFQHTNYRGRMLVLYGSNSDLPAIDFNDQLSSFIITGGHWTLYEHIKYQGKCVTLGPGKYTSATALSGAGGNDKISSIKAKNWWDSVSLP